jgi:conjugal transfer pilus assembly protein TraE
MDITVSHQRAQAYLRQRNMLAFVCCGLLALSLWSFIALSGKKAQYILVPTVSSPLKIDSTGVSREYLEVVTRDAANLILNRSPAGLDYWMSEILGLVHPSSYGRMKAEMLKLVTDLKGSSVSQSFSPTKYVVDPKALTSTIEGELRTYVGTQEVSRARHIWRIRWNYTGLRLSMLSFDQVMKEDPAAKDLLAN